MKNIFTKVLKAESNHLAFLLYAIVAVFFSYQFVLRLAPSVLMDKIGEAAFGNLGSYYYLGYAGMQIPFGLMLDRFNFRHVSLIAVLTCVLGNSLFSFSESWNLVLFGRFLIGCGSAIGFLAVAKVIKIFFKEEYQSILIGFAFTIGLLGAVFGNNTLNFTFSLFGIYNVLAAISVIGFIIAVGLMLLNDKHAMSESKYNSQTEEQDEEMSSKIKNIFKIISMPSIIIAGISGGLMAGSLEGFADLWGSKFFQSVMNFSKPASISINSNFFIGMCLGGPVLAFLARAVSSDVVVISLVAMFMAIMFSVLFYFTNMNFLTASMVMLFMGMLASYQVLVFSFASKLVNAEWTGLAIAVINCINMSFGSIFHTIVSNLIEYNWSGVISTEGVKLYDYTTMVAAFTPIPIAAIIGQVGFLYLGLKQINFNLSSVFAKSENDNQSSFSK